MFLIPAGLNSGFQYAKAITDYDTAINQNVAGEPVDLLEDALDEKDVVATVNDRTLFIGKTAIERSDTVYFSLNEDKPNDEISNFISIATLAQALPYDCECRVVNALPFRFYFSQKADAQSKLLGDYRTIVNGIERNFSIIDIRTTLQGLDLIFNEILDDDGNVCVPWAANLLASIDFGFYTTILTVVNQLKPVEVMCKTIPIGVWKAWDILTKYLEKELDYSIKIEEIDELIKNEPVINVRGVKQDISAAVDSAIKSTAHAIQGQIMRYWPHRQFYKIFSGGGGQKRYGDLILPGELTPVNNPQIAGATGCLKRAKREAIWQKSVG